MAILLLITSIDFTSFAAEPATEETVAMESLAEDEAMNEAAAAMENEEETKTALTEDILPEAEWTTEGIVGPNDVTMDLTVTGRLMVIQPKEQRILLLQYHEVHGLIHPKSMPAMAGGGCARPATVVTMPRLSITMATSTTMATMSTAVIMPFVPLCISIYPLPQCGVRQEP